MNNVYSFLDVNLSMLGPGIVSKNLGAGAAIADEGITVESVSDKNEMTIGADGKGQHSLMASDARKLTIRLLKTSPANAALQTAYDVQSQSSALWGQNAFVLSDSARGDFLTLQACAFKKQPTITYAKEAGIMEWEFDVISGNAILGGG